MRKPKLVGLVASGRLSDSPLARLPILTRDLGPVAAGSKRLASRYSNSLRSGRPAGDWSELAPARVLYIQVPSEEVEPTLASLLRTLDVWDRRIAIISSPSHGSAVLEPLAARGAAVASLSAASMLESTIAVIEGDSRALSYLRGVLRSGGIRAVQLQQGGRPLFNAALLLASSIAAPAAEASWRALRLAGVTPLIARRIAERETDLAIRAAIAHGKRAWSNPASAAQRALTLRQLNALRDTDPQLAAYTLKSLAAALGFHNEDASFLPETSVPAPARAAP